ncbi:hydrolase [Marinomonas ushuaiensis]|uniref:hydrolase n=1 Tax=Marinomonas ushuaiensis TaxID=263818 RepID=UPI001FDEA7B5|nr:hydrolase [Marinomonas ushuaiensis]
MDTFKPHFLLRNKHVQTMYATFFRKPISLDIEREMFELSDGDFVECFWLDKPKQGDKTPIVVLFHGLEGSYESPYIQGMMQALQANGYACVLMHFRGCSGKNNRLPRSYHSGDTADANAWFAHLEESFPESSLYAVGYSLGGNMLLKLLGESGEKSLLKGAVAISAPMLLSNSAETITKGTARVYQQYLLKPLKQKLLEKYQQHDMESLLGKSLSQVKNIKTVREFDDVYTSKINGFKDAEDYYEQNSAQQFLPTIRTKTLIIHALDDPFMTPVVLPNRVLGSIEGIQQNAKNDGMPSCVEFSIQQYGGHVGFVGGTPLKPTYFIEERVIRFLDEQGK